MTRKARLLVVTASVGQTVTLGLLWAFAIPPLLRLPGARFGLHLVGVALMLVVLNLVQGGLGLVFRWRHPMRSQSEMPVRMLATTLIGSVCAVLVGWIVVQHRLGHPHGLAVSVAALGMGAVVAVVTLVASREFLRRTTARELGEDPAFGVATRERRSRIGLRGYLLITLLVLGGGSAALVGAYGYVQADHEDALRRERLAETYGRLAARRLASVPRTRLATKLWHMPLPQGFVMRLVGSDGVAFAPVPRARQRAGARSWRVALEGDGRCRSGNPGVRRCRWAALGFPYEDLRLVVLVTQGPPTSSPLVVSVLIFSLVLLGFAAFVTHLMGADAAHDLEAVARAIARVTDQPEDGLGAPIPPSTTDEVGLLLQRFGELRTWLAGELSVSQVDVDRHTALDRDKARYLEEVSFALRTELTGIIGPAELLLEGASGRLTPGQRQDVEILLDSARQLLGLVRDILDISYAEAGAIRLRPAPVDLAALVESEVTAARAARQDDVVGIRADLPPKLPTLELDEVHIRRVLANLLSNAVKFTDEGEVRVVVTREGDGVRVGVRDTGPGIAEEHQAVIFEQYRQAPQSRVKQQRGSGLGLAIAQQLVRLHGGSWG